MTILHSYHSFLSILGGIVLVCLYLSVAGRDNSDLMKIWSCVRTAPICVVLVNGFNNVRALVPKRKTNLTSKS